METLVVDGGELRLAFDAQTGRWLSLNGGTTERSWIAADSNTSLPFVATTGLERGHTIELPCACTQPNVLHGTSHRKKNPPADQRN